MCRLPDELSPGTNVRRTEMNPNSCVVLVAVASLCALASAAGCKYSVESYTTTDAMIVTEAAFIAQITATECEDSPSNLYAEVEGKLVVAANAGPNKYQVSPSVLCATALLPRLVLISFSASRGSRSAGWTTSRRLVEVITPSSCTMRLATDSCENCCVTVNQSAAWRPCTLRMYVTLVPTRALG